MDRGSAEAPVCRSGVALGLLGTGDKQRANRFEGTLPQQTVKIFGKCLLLNSISFSPNFCMEPNGVVPEIVRISVFEIYYVFDKTLGTLAIFCVGYEKYTSLAVMNGLNSSGAVSTHHTF